MNPEQTFHLLGLLVVAAPTALLAIFGLSSLVGLPLSEKAMARLTQAAVWVGLLSALGILGMMLALGYRLVPVELGHWVSLTDANPDNDFHFHLKFVFDRLSVPFTILTFVLCGTIGAFTSRYLHREPGYGRFFIFYAIFLMGMVVSAVSGTIETLFLGWEMVGLSSALLVAFFHERVNPVRNGQRVWTVYRIADAAFLLAALSLHHLTGEGDFAGLMGSQPWPEGVAAISPGHALFVGLLLLIAAAGKSALVPFSGWLPRAMEGPTPSSAVFYGALSVHLGAFLLLRVSPLLQASLPLSIAVIAVGLISAAYGALAARVQTDVKTALAFASLTQVGIIVAEIGFGWWYLALIHMIGHACLRTLQLLRAPTLLQDYHSMENAIGSRLPVTHALRSRLLPQSAQNWLYRFSMDRGFLDAVLNEYVVAPVLKLFRFCDRLERRWTDFLSGEDSRKTAPEPVSLEDLT